MTKPLHACPDCGASHPVVHSPEQRLCEQCGALFMTKRGQGARNRQRFCDAHSGNRQAVRRYQQRRAALNAGENQA